MPLKTLLFNRGIYIQNMRSVGWAGIAYFLAMFFAVPLQILMIYTRQDYRGYTRVAENLFQVNNAFQLIIMFTVPLIVAIFIFRYMHVKLSADYIHSLPVKREALYIQHLLFGLIVLIVPILLVAVILFVIGNFTDLPHLLNATEVGNWVGTTILMTVFVFLATVFVGMFTGMSVLHGILTYIMLFFPAGITMLFLMNGKYLLYGLSIDYYLDQKMEKIIPFARASQFGYEALTVVEVLTYLLFTIGFALIALFVYKKRKAETATQAIAFKALEPVFLYGVTLCTMLLGGVYFGETQGSISWIIFGYVFASIIGYFVALMIIEKTWRVLKKWKGYGIYVVAICVVGVFLQVDVIGFEKRIPVTTDIERVYFGDSVYLMDDRAKAFSDTLAPDYYYYETENIEYIVSLHEQIIAERQLYENRRWNWKQIVFGYELSNGKKLVRIYRVPADFYEIHADLYGPLVESTEHKHNVNTVLRIDELETIDKIMIVSHRGNRNVTLTERQDINEFHQLLQTEIMNESYEDVVDDRQVWSSIEYLLRNNERVYSGWKKSYDELETWLDQRGLLKQARLTADDIAYAVVTKRDEGLLLYEYMRYEKEMLDFETNPGTIRIDEFEQLEQCLVASTWNETGEFVIAYYLKNQMYSPFFETISLKHAPIFLTDLIH